MSLQDFQWHSTDDDAQSVRITSVDSISQAEEVSVPRAKRSPAAFIGVAVFLAIGFTVFQGISGIAGQAMTEAIKVNITDNGADPLVITLKPGETVEWTNTAAIPHILESDTLPTEDDSRFESRAIFPSGTFSYTIPLDAVPGTYDYISRTSPDFAGQIIITSAEAGVTDKTALPLMEADANGELSNESVTITPTTPPPASVSSAFIGGFNDPSSLTADPVLASNDISSAPQASSAFSYPSMPDAFAMGDLPQNTHTVAQMGSEPIPMRALPNNQVLHSGAPSTAETGYETLWVVLGLSAFGVYMLTRKFFA